MDQADLQTIQLHEIVALLSWTRADPTHLFKSYRNCSRAASWLGNREPAPCYRHHVYSERSYLIAMVVDDEYHPPINNLTLKTAHPGRPQLFSSPRFGWVFVGWGKGYEV